jgi:hypothetical protein
MNVLDELIQTSELICWKLDYNNFDFEAANYIYHSFIVWTFKKTKSWTLIWDGHKKHQKQILNESFKRK